MMDRAELQKIMDAPGFGSGRRFRDQKAQEADAIATLPDPKRMAPVRASTSATDDWLIASFGNSNEDDRDWHLVTDNVRASEMNVWFPEDAKTDAHAVAALLNAWRMGLIVLKGDE